MQADEDENEHEEVRGFRRHPDDVVDDNGPDDGLDNRVRELEERSREGEGPAGVEEVVALLREDGQALHLQGEGRVRKPVFDVSTTPQLGASENQERTSIVLLQEVFDVSTTPQLGASENQK